MRGVSIAIFLLCVSVFATFMGASGVSSELGVGLGDGLDGPSDKVEEDLDDSDKSVNDAGGGGGLLGYATYAIRTLSVFFALFGSVGSLLTAWAGGRFQTLWMGIQSVVIVIGSMMIVSVARGLIVE